MNEDELSLLILCGGQGLRMGGRDKPLLIYRGQPMIDHILASVPARLTRIISANRSLLEYQRRGQVVTDSSTGLSGSGPLIGIYAGLQQCRTPWLLISPGDTPRLPSDWSQRMWQAAGGRHHVVAFDGERQQHLHLLLKRESALSSLEEFLAGGHHQVFRWLELLQPVRAAFDDPAAFHNINEPTDLQNRT